MKLWSGSFSVETNKQANDFQSSIHFDSRMYREDIEGSKAHAAMLASADIISNSAADEIISELDRILADIESGKVTFTSDNEDIHMNIESLLTERIGQNGKRLHTARSRNDQVAVDLRMYIKREISEICGGLKSLIEAITDTASNHLETIMPGYTHLQRAQPITFAHHIMAYAEMFFRDYERLADCYTRTDVSPLGSCALATTTYQIDRNMTASSLGFSTISRNSLDAVSDRDFVIELASALSIIMMHLSRICEEIILWSSHEFSFISLDESFSTGSSIMPQKKNPDVAELIRGKAGRVYGNLMGILTVMKSLPLAYNKDMQEDKECIFDSIDTVKQCLSVFVPMFLGIVVNKSKMYNAAAEGFLNATDCADYLTRKGAPFRDAYTVTGSIIKYCTEKGLKIEDLDISELKSFSPLFDEDIYASLDLLDCVKQRNAPGGPAPECVLSHIEWMKKQLDQIEN
ncbi:MAG: argininosuccinate lyase [Clostridiales bacterium]|jgi:argininosuccinate lyase|nr:argininosuccinate lyase [Clostridiales bacterium]